MFERADLQICTCTIHVMPKGCDDTKESRIEGFHPPCCSKLRAPAKLRRTSWQEIHTEFYRGSSLEHFHVDTKEYYYGRIWTGRL
jgi:hypothetical protein